MKVCHYWLTKRPIQTLTVCCWIIPRWEWAADVKFSVVDQCHTGPLAFWGFLPGTSGCGGLIRGRVRLLGFGIALLGACQDQIWSLTQFCSVDFLQSRIVVKKCVFKKRTINVCVSCCWRCPGNSATSAAHLIVSWFLCSSGSNGQGKSRAFEGRRVSSKSPSSVRDGDKGVAGNGRE